jgi:uncharacterized RDD family membrane protein YckC
MADEKKIIPPPTIQPSTPAPPPPTPSFETADPEPSKAEEPEIVETVDEQEEEEAAEVSPHDDVEVDLVKRFLGALVDGLVAAVFGYVGALATGSEVVQWVLFGIVFLTRDSLPFLDGQSIGKKVVKTKAVKHDGSSLSGDWVTGATRNILLALPYVGLIECFILLTRSGNPGAGFRLGDDWAKTKVISVE